MAKKSSKPAHGTQGNATPAVVFLHHAGVAFREAAYSHDDDVTDFGAEAAQALGVDADRVYKTLLLSPADSTSGPASKKFGVVVVSVNRQVSMKAAAAALGWKKAQMADPAAAQRHTGYVVGGISPFGQKQPSPTVLDAAAMDLASIYVSGGRRGLDVEVAPADLVSALGATVAPITA